MHLYWRIKEELLYLGEVLVFLDPRFTREYGRWEKKRFLGLRNTGVSESLRRDAGFGRSVLNLNN